MIPYDEFIARRRARAASAGIDVAEGALHESLKPFQRRIVAWAAIGCRSSGHARSRLARPIWYGVQEGNTLNVRVAREADDERHLTPLQLDFIERCVRLWSNPGELVFTAFGGVGSELYVSVKHGRRALGIELKPSYWRTGVGYLRALEHEQAQPTFDWGEAS